MSNVTTSQAQGDWEAEALKRIRTDRGVIDWAIKILEAQAKPLSSEMEQQLAWLREQRQQAS